MKAKNADCANCPFQSCKVVPSAGNAIRLIVIGDCPEQSDVIYRKPFTGASGSYLKQLLQKFGVSPDEVFYTNAVLCLPKGKRDKDKLAAAAHACYGRLTYALNSTKDVPVLVLGDIPKQVLGISLQDQWVQLHTGHWAIATVHPSDVLFNPTTAIHLVKAINKVLHITPYLGEISALQVVTHPQELPTIRRMSKLCVDIETTTTDVNNPDGRIVLFGYSYLGEFDEVVSVVLTADVVYSQEGKKFICQLLQDNAGVVGGHNFKYDLRFLHREIGSDIVPHWDTMLAVKTINEYWYKDLKSLSTYYFDADDYADRLVHSWLELNVTKKSDRSFDKIPQAQLVEYLTCDLYYNLLLSYKLDDELHQCGKYHSPYYEYELPLSYTLACVEEAGFTVDLKQVNEEQAAFNEDILELFNRISIETGGSIKNPASPKQVAEYLYGTLALPFPTDTGNKPGSTADAVLEKLSPLALVVSQVRNFRRVSKLKTSYLDNLVGFVDTNSKVHPIYKQAHVVTGRLSAVSPAIQTIPKKNERKDGENDYGKRVKLCYTASPGNCLVAVDGSQWELRVATAWSQDPYMVDIYQRGVDFHGEMCDLLYGPGWTSAMRTIEKNIVFGLLYGGKLESLVSVAHIPDEVKLRVLNVFNTKLLRILAWRDELFNQAKTLGVITSPYFNRDFHFDLVTQANQRDIQKECVNYPVQGTAADITNLAMVRALPKLRSIGASIVATVHDSILVDTPIHRAIEAANILARELALAGAQVFPIIPWQAEAEMGFRWGELKPMELTHE